MSQKKKPNDLASQLVDSLLQQRGRANSQKVNRSPKGAPGVAAHGEGTNSTKSALLADSRHPVGSPESTKSTGVVENTGGEDDPFLTTSAEATIPFVAATPTVPEVKDFGGLGSGDDARLRDSRSGHKVRTDLAPTQGRSERVGHEEKILAKALRQESGAAGEGNSPTHQGMHDQDTARSTAVQGTQSQGRVDDATRLLTQFREKLTSAFQAPSGEIIPERDKRSQASLNNQVVDGPEGFVRETEKFRNQTKGSSVGRPEGASRTSHGLLGGGVLPASEATLAQAESLRFAQDRLLELEREIDGLRRDNDQLAVAGEALQRRLDETLAINDNLEIRHRENLELHAEEKKSLRESLLNKRLEVERLQSKVDELEMRLASDLKKIRVRERELENRLELLKMEGAALLRSKDEVILELKRDVDRLSSEAENFRIKNQELHRQIDLDQDKFRRTVRALRLALSMLESDEEAMTLLKKAE